jgi:putative protease
MEYKLWFVSNHKKIYIGKVTNYFNKIGVANFLLETQSLSVGDEIRLQEKLPCLRRHCQEIRVDLLPVEKEEKGTPSR